MSKRIILFDDGITRQTAVHQPSENRVYVETDQPNKEKILRGNVRDANNSEAHRDMRLALRIPEEDFSGVCARYPEFLTGTQEEQLRAIEKIAKAHPEYVRIQPRQRVFPVLT